MSDEKQTPSAANKWARMPAEVQRSLKRRIVLHLQHHRSRHYDLLREDPEFAPWIGAARGEAGEKRLDRMIRRVRASHPSLRADRFDAEREPELKAAEARSISSISVVAMSPAQVLSGAHSALVGLNELQNLYFRGIPRLQLAIDNLVDDDGQVIDNDDLVKLHRELRATINDVGLLQQRYLAAVKSTEFLQGLFELLATELQDEPDRLHELLTDINDLMERCGGLPATSKELT